MSIQEKLQRLCELEPLSFRMVDGNNKPLPTGGLRWRRYDCAWQLVNILDSFRDWSMAGYLLEQMQERWKAIWFGDDDGLADERSTLRELWHSHMSNLTPESILDAFLAWKGSPKEGQ